MQTLGDTLGCSWGSRSNYHAGFAHQAVPDLWAGRAPLSYDAGRRAAPTGFIPCGCTQFVVNYHDAGAPA